MKKLSVALIVIGLVAVIAIAVTAGVFLRPKPAVNSAPSPTVNITYQNIGPVLAGSDIVQAVPDDSSIVLKFYNFNSGQRQWEKSFIIKRGEVVEGAENADIILTLDSKYLNGLTNKNFCSMIQQARKNNDLGIETSLSPVSLAWKFKSMYQFRSCFGF